MHVLIGLAVMALAAGEGVKAQEWSEPVTLVEGGEQVLGSHFDTALDSNGNIHLVYWMQRYQERDLNHRVLYCVFNPHGNPIREPILPFDEDSSNCYGNIAIDPDDNIFILCEDGFDYRETGNTYTYFLTCLDNEGEYLIDPVMIDGLTFDNEDHNIIWPHYFFRRSDGTFVLAGLIEVWVDSLGYNSIIFYADISPEGELIGDIHYLFSDENAERGYSQPKACLDRNDNLHFYWRSRGRLYGCVDRDGEILTEPTRIERYNQFEDRMYICDMAAVNSNAVYFLLEDYDTPNQDSVYFNLLKMNHTTEEIFFVRLFASLNHGGGTLSNWMDRIHISGLFDRPLRLYYCSADTNGNLLEYPEDILRCYSASNVVERLGDTLSVIYYYPIPHSSSSDIRLVQKIYPPVSAPDMPTYITPDDFEVKYASPNPSNNGFAVDISLPAPSDITISLYDLSGRLICMDKIHFGTSGWHRVSIPEERDIGTLPTGQYILKAESPAFGVKSISLTYLK